MKAIKGQKGDRSDEDESDSQVDGSDDDTDDIDDGAAREPTVAELETVIRPRVTRAASYFVSRIETHEEEVRNDEAENARLRDTDVRLRNFRTYGALLNPQSFLARRSSTRSARSARSPSPT